MNRPHSLAGNRHPADAVDGVDADTARAQDSVSVSSVGSVNGAHELDIVNVDTRREALADGVLVDVSRQASPAEMRGGFTVPVAVTAVLWSAIEAIPDSLVGIADARGRLHDVLWMASLAVRRRARASFAFFACSQSMQFAVHLPYRGTRKRTQWLAVAIGPDDDGSPCVTIGFPEDF